MNKIASLLLVAPIFLLLTAQAPPEPEKAVRIFRVSADILPFDSAEQPETQAEPYVAVNPENEKHLVAVYQEGRNIQGGGARAITVAVSTDGGRKWRETFLPGSPATGGPYKRISDPWVAFGPGNRVYCSVVALNEIGAESGIFVSASPDGGRTWGDLVAVHTLSNHLDDKEAIVVDTRSDSPYRGRVYVAWDANLGGGDQDLQSSYSDDEGRTWSPSVSLSRQGANVGAIPLVGPGGILHVVWAHVDRQTGAPALWAARSEDGGNTWSAPVQVSTLSPGLLPEIRHAGIVPSSAIDPRTGHLYVVWTDERFSPGINKILLSRSTDGGQGWTEPQVVSDGPANAQSFTPAVAVAGNGRVGVAYSSLRNAPDRRYLVDEYLAVSKNNGQSFGASKRISPISWDIRFAAIADESFFLGDYQGLGAGKASFYPVWVATLNVSRLDPPARQPDVFTVSVPAR